jgi:hypothetical protein
MDRLFQDQVEPPSSPLYWVLGGLFIVLILGSLYVYVLSYRRQLADRFHRRLAGRYGGLIASFSGLGFAATLFGFLTVPFLSKRLWLVVALLGLAGSLGHGFWYWRRRYPAAREAYDKMDRRRRYLPRPKRRR